MKLLGAVAYDPASRVQHSVSSLLAMTALDTTNARITFTAPASGKVFWRVSCAYVGTGTGGDKLFLGVLDGSTVRARRAGMTSERQVGVLEMSGVIDGLTPSSSYTFDAAYGVDNVASGNFEYGGPNDTTADNASGALIFEIWAVDV